MPQKHRRSKDDLHSKDDQSVTNCGQLLAHPRFPKTGVSHLSGWAATVRIPIAAGECAHFVPLIENVNGIVVLDANDHGFENVHIPAVSDTQSDDVARLGQQPSAQRYAKASCYHSKNYRLPHPDFVTTFHRRPLLRVTSANEYIFEPGSNLTNGTGG
jgi:hypothetical protein